MRRILYIILLFTFGSSHGQDNLTGKWYTLSFDMLKVVQYNFEGSTFVSNKLDWKLQNQPGTQTARVIKTIQKRGNLYYLLQDVSDTSVISLVIFSSVVPNSSFVQATTSEEHSAFRSLAEALAFIEVDTFPRPGLFFYSQKQFDRVKSLPDASTITKDNYKIYLQGLIEEKENFKKFASKHKDEFPFMFVTIYLPNQARKVLANLGYNPVIDDQQLERVNERFKDDPTLKDLMSKALKLE
jgi:hypothetical protein